MKKTMLLFIFIGALNSQIFGQNVNTVLSRLEKHENTEKVSVGSFGMFLVKLAGGNEALQGMKGIKSFELLTLNNQCPADQKSKIHKQLKELKDDSTYATLMLIKDGENHIRFLINKEKEKVKELILIILSQEEQKNESVVIRLKGKFKESDLADLVAKCNKMGDER